MHARAVRFTDVTPERIAEIKERIGSEDGPPPGVDSTAMKLLFDESQSTAIFIGFFDSEDKMRAAGEVLANMDASEVPGSRDSVDECEVVIEREA